MAEITLFTAPKPFTNPHIATIQRNAIQNWTHLGPQVEVLLMGREEGMAEVSAELGVRHVHEVKCNEAGPPLINSMIDFARSLTDSPFLAISNADVLYMPDLISATQAMARLKDKFLLLGQRWDLDVQQELDFSPGWDKVLWQDVKARGKLHPPLGSDYFIFPRDLFTDIPDFTIGRSAWDNWMIYYANEQGWAVVDATPSLRIIHQDHDYSHLPGNRPPYKLPETKKNIDLAGGLDNLLTIMDIPTQLVDGELRPAPASFLRLVRKVEVMVDPKDGRKNGIRWALTRQVRKLRRRLTEDYQ
jgi:hypothetical protein